jgi:hypothetical protein
MQGFVFPGLSMEAHIAPCGKIVDQRFLNDILKLKTGKELMFWPCVHMDALAKICTSLPILMRLSTPKNAKKKPQKIPLAASRASNGRTRTERASSEHFSRQSDAKPPLILSLFAASLVVGEMTATWEQARDNSLECPKMGWKNQPLRGAWMLLSED